MVCKYAMVVNLVQAREPQKVRLDATDVDTSSNGELVLDLVLSYLPTRDCVRASVLSSRWRDKWTTVPNLLFDADCWQQSCVGNLLKWGSIDHAGIINHVLSIHSCSVQSFQIKDLPTFPDIDVWILHVSKYSIKTLVLELLGTLIYTVPSSLFKCGSLSSLRLRNCILMLPPSYFKGFNNLKILDLEKVTLTDDALEKLISSCPLLEKLTLIDLRGVSNIKIDAPNLKHVDISAGISEIITFGHSSARPLIISIHKHEWGRNVLAGYWQTSLIELFIKHPNIRRLGLKGSFIKHLADDFIPKSMPFQWKDLCHLALNINFCDHASCLVAICLFRSSPNLRVLEMESTGGDPYMAIYSVWRNPSKCVWEYKELRSLKVKIFGLGEEELGFIEFMLGNSHVLEKITITIEPDFVYWGDVMSIYGFKRASDRAKIILDGRSVKKSCDSDWL